MSYALLPASIALGCDDRAIIQEVFQDEIGLAGLTPGQPLGRLVDSSSQIKLLNFLVEIRTRGTAFGWDINIQKESRVIPLSLAGAVEKSNMIIVFAHTQLDALGLLSRLIEIDSGQNTSLQIAIKNQMEFTRAQSGRDGLLYDEISRLNNELITLQRDLAKKNAELERLNEKNRKLNQELELDIAERKRVEITLRRSEERFREVLENSLDASYKRDLQTGVYDYLSPVFVELTGYTPDEMKTKSMEDFLSLTHPDDMAEIKRVITGSMSGAAGTAYPMEYRFKHKNGTYQWLQDQFNIMRDADGLPLALIGSVRNITESKLLADKMEQSQKLADLGTLAAGIAHEINTPLQIITGSTGNLLGKLENGGADFDSFKTRLERINQNAWRIAGIVHAVLAYARSSNDEVAPAGLNDLVQDVLLLTEHQMHVWSNIEIITDLAVDLPEFPCDRNKIIQALINLLNNARDAMPEGGKLTIRTAFDPQLKNLNLVMSDTGNGIPPDVCAKIFDPFFTTKPLGQGTGLGLSIVLGIVHSHGGEVRVESEPGKGSSFTLTFALTASLKVQITPPNGRFNEF